LTGHNADLMKLRITENFEEDGIFMEDGFDLID
jgi:hypothetical protein